MSQLHCRLSRYNGPLSLLATDTCAMHAHCEVPYKESISFGVTISVLSLVLHQFLTTFFIVQAGDQAFSTMRNENITQIIRKTSKRVTVIKKQFDKDGGPWGVMSRNSHKYNRHQVVFREKGNGSEKIIQVEFIRVGNVLWRMVCKGNGYQKIIQVDFVRVGNVLWLMVCSCPPRLIHSSIIIQVTIFLGQETCCGAWYVFVSLSHSFKHPVRRPRAKKGEGPPNLER